MNIIIFRYKKITFSLLSCFLIGVGGFTLASAQENGATFFLSPSAGKYDIGEEFDLQLNLNTEDPVTSIRVYLNYDPSLVAVTQIDTDVDAFPYWWEQEQEDGMLKLQASAPSPGVQGETKIADLRFKVLGAGAAVLAFDSSSLALTPQDENILNLDPSSWARFSFGAQVLPDSGFETQFPSVGLILIIFGLAGGVLLAFYFFQGRQKRKSS
ncbi:hypothetical protein IID24_00905 [Patescibacteria group bacterium]|nr:hypothetical protein [Patescibacteria group bacterium]